jgi:beta-lactamase regulating signal transducer with metallopeptidase domain
MGLVLLFYHAVLAREKIFQINRFYLLAGLLISLIIPLLPIGIFDSVIRVGSNTEIPKILSGNIENINLDSGIQFSLKSNENNSTSYLQSIDWISLFIICFYSIVTILLFFRMIRYLYQLQLKSMKNPSTVFNGYKVILEDEKVAPHTFWKTIFVNRDQYNNKKITEEVMIHELIHAKQNHSIDILIVEFLKTIFWFNPVLYFYKTAIQLNHEYIADEKVLFTGTDIAEYQTLLLKMRTANTANFLSTSLNFNITKKRFKMMTLNYSRYRSYLKISLIIPFFVVLGITLGCEPAELEKSTLIDQIKLEVVDAETIKINGDTVPAPEFESAFSDLSIDPKYTLIDIKVHKNASMGLVTDVQEILRKYGPLRINYTTKKSSDDQSKDAWRANLDNRNILDIHINEVGQTIVNQEIIPISSLKGLITRFLTNNGESTNLSESPAKAIIAITIEKNTPSEVSLDKLEIVMGVYEELRNQAAIEMFDKPFGALADGSDEKSKIENMYPKRISIKDQSRI